MISNGILLACLLLLVKAQDNYVQSSRQPCETGANDTPPDTWREACAEEGKIARKVNGFWVCVQPCVTQNICGPGTDQSTLHRDLSGAWRCCQEGEVIYNKQCVHPDAIPPSSGQTPGQPPQQPPYGQPPLQPPYGQPPGQPPIDTGGPGMPPSEPQPPFGQPPQQPPQQPPYGQPPENPGPPGQPPQQPPGQPPLQPPYGQPPTNQGPPGQPPYGQPPGQPPIDTGGPGMPPPHPQPPYGQPPGQPPLQPPYGQPPTNPGHPGQPPLQPPQQPPHGQPPGQPPIDTGGPGMPPPHPQPPYSQPPGQTPQQPPYGQPPGQTPLQPPFSQPPGQPPRQPVPPAPGVCPDPATLHQDSAGLWRCCQEGDVLYNNQCTRPGAIPPALGACGAKAQEGHFANLLGGVLSQCCPNEKGAHSALTQHFNNVIGGALGLVDKFCSKDCGQPKEDTWTCAKGGPCNWLPLEDQDVPKRIDATGSSQKVLPHPNVNNPKYKYPFDTWLTAFEPGLELYVSGKRISPDATGTRFLIPGGVSASDVTYQAEKNYHIRYTGACSPHTPCVGGTIRDWTRIDLKNKPRGVDVDFSQYNEDVVLTVADAFGLTEQQVIYADGKEIGLTHGRLTLGSDMYNTAHLSMANPIPNSNYVLANDGFWASYRIPKGTKKINISLKHTPLPQSTSFVCNYRVDNICKC